MTALCYRVLQYYDELCGNRLGGSPPAHPPQRPRSSPSKNRLGHGPCPPTRPAGREARHDPTLRPCCCCSSYQTCTADCCHNVRPVLAHLAAFPVSGEAQFRAVDGATPHWGQCHRRWGSRRPADVWPSAPLDAREDRRGIPVPGSARRATLDARCFGRSILRREDVETAVRAARWRPSGVPHAAIAASVFV